MTMDGNQQLTALEEAKAEITSGDRLRKLATSDDRAIRKAVTSNPNTPTDILWQLGAEFPDQLLANPVWDLLLLEHPNLFGDMPSETLESLLSRATGSFFELVSRDINDKVRRVVASNSNTPPAVLEKLATDENMWVRQRVAKNSNTPVKLLQKLATDGDTWVRHEVVTNPNTPPTLLQILATDRDRHVRYEVARNNNTPPTALQILACDLDSGVRDEAARNTESRTVIF